MKLYQKILLIIVSPLILYILYILYSLIFTTFDKLFGYDNFENGNQVTTTSKVYKSNRSKCFDCEKQNKDSFQTPCFSCNQKLSYPNEDNTPGRYLQR